MSSPIDLTNLTLVHQFLNIVSQTFTLSAAANASAGTTVYTGTAFNPIVNAYVGQSFTVTGFTTPANNGTFACTASDSSTITLSNAAGVAETDTAFAALGSPDDPLISAFITDVSEFITNLTGRDILYTAGNPTGSIFTAVQTFTEILDGNGGIRLFPRNTPLQTVTSIQFGNLVVPQSTGINSPGWFIEQNQRSIAIRAGGSGSFNFTNFGPFGGLSFRFGSAGNVGVGSGQIVYTAGWATTPQDLQMAATKLVAYAYKQKDVINLSMQSNPSAGSTTYRNVAVPPEVLLVIVKYTRQALV